MQSFYIDCFSVSNAFGLSLEYRIFKKNTTEAGEPFGEVFPKKIKNFNCVFRWILRKVMIIIQARLIVFGGKTMPIINPSQAKNLEKIRIQTPSVLLDEIKNYCKEFSIAEMEDFFNEAAKYVLKSDKDWQKIAKKA